MPKNYYESIPSTGFSVIHQIGNSVMNLIQQKNVLRSKSKKMLVIFGSDFGNCYCEIMVTAFFYKIFI